MGHRLSKIYTRTGDDGRTGLGDNQRVDKDWFPISTGPDKKQALVKKNIRVETITSEFLDRIDFPWIIGKHLI